MVILSAQRMQKLAEALQRMERSVEASGSEVEERVEREAERSLDPATYEDHEEDLTGAAGRMGVELTTLRSVDTGTLQRLLSGGPGRSSGRLWAGAEILYVDGLLARAAGRPGDARGRWRKARELFALLDPDLELPDVAGEPERRIEAIDELLRQTGRRD